MNPKIDYQTFITHLRELMKAGVSAAHLYMGAPLTLDTATPQLEKLIGMFEGLAAARICVTLLELLGEDTNVAGETTTSLKAELTALLDTAHEAIHQMGTDQAKRRLN